jgi:23S rRNA pseudouridine1911/1915/1917 synthase
MARQAGGKARAMPSKNMLPKGQRRRSVKAEYRATRGVEAEADEAIVPELDLDEDTDVEDGVRTFAADAAAAGMRLDAYLAQAIPEISRARVQLLIEAGRCGSRATRRRQSRSCGRRGD